MKCTRFAIATLAGLVLSLPSSAFAQEKAPEKGTPEKPAEAPEKTKKDLELWPIKPEGGQSAQDKVKEIIERLEKNLVNVDEMLLQATLDNVDDLQEQIVDDFNKLMNQAGQAQNQVVSDIDELIANAPRSSSKGSSGSSSGKKPKSGQEKQSEQQKRQQEAKRDRSSDQQKQGEEEQESNAKKDEKTGKKDRASKKPTDKSGKPSDRADIVDRWGTLPPMLKDRISKREFTNFPPEYREKLMQYYKRLNDDDR